MFFFTKLYSVIQRKRRHDAVIQVQLYTLLFLTLVMQITFFENHFITSAN